MQNFGALEIDAQPADIRFLRECFVKQDVWLRPFDRLAYIMPPLTIASDELEQLITAMRDGLQAWAEDK